jgi:hypothetical protein
MTARTPCGPDCTPACLAADAELHGARTFGDPHRPRHTSSADRPERAAKLAADLGRFGGFPEQVSDDLGDLEDRLRKLSEPGLYAAWSAALVAFRELPDHDNIFASGGARLRAAFAKALERNRP